MVFYFLLGFLTFPLDFGFNGIYFLSVRWKYTNVNPETYSVSKTFMPLDSKLTLKIGFLLPVFEFLL